MLLVGYFTVVLDLNRPDSQTGCVAVCLVTALLSLISATTGHFRHWPVSQRA